MNLKFYILIGLYLKLKGILVQCEKPKLKRTNHTKMARTENWHFGRQKLLFCYLFIIDCIYINWMSYSWISDDPSILVTRKKIKMPTLSADFLTVHQF